MKFKIIFVCVFFFGCDFLVKINGLPELSETTSEAHPYHAVVQAKMVCNGILITNNYVITPANCVYGSTDATVYLGFHGYPLYKSHHSEPNIQIIHSSNIIVHEDFANIYKHYLNNIALVKLSKPATLSEKVQPGTLLSRQESYLLEGKYAEVSGWQVSSHENKKMTTVQIRNRDTCRYLFEDQFLSSQEFCVKWFTKSRLNLLGNSVRIDNNIIGFQTYTPHCVEATSGCTQNDMILNFIPFLDWMSHEMHVSIEEFTSKSPESCDNQDLTKLEDSVKKINETLYKEINNLRKYDGDLADLNKKFENIVTELQNAKTEQNKFSLSLNEQITAISTEINNSKIQIDQNIINLQEQLNSIRTEVTGGLIAEQSLNDLQANFIDLNDTVQMKINEQTDKFKEQIKEVANKTNNNELEERVLQLQKDATKLFKKLQDTEITQQAVDERIGYINTTIKSILSGQHHLQSQFNYSKEEFKNHLELELDLFAKLEKTLIDTGKAVEKNKLEAHIRLGEIENVFDEQRHHMDEHIVREFTQLYSLEAEIKSMNVSLNNIMNLIYHGQLLN